jgi:hypothetical protein
MTEKKLVSEDWPECEEFYNLMQAYRHTPVFDPALVIIHYEKVKEYLRMKVNEMLAAAPVETVPAHERNPASLMERSEPELADRLISISFDGSTHTRQASEWLNLARNNLMGRSEPSYLQQPKTWADRYYTLFTVMEGGRIPYGFPHSVYTEWAHEVSKTFYSGKEPVPFESKTINKEHNTFWLVERGYADNHIPTIFLKSWKAFKCHAPYDNMWTETAHQAQKYDSKEAASIAADEIGNCRATEHMFINSKQYGEK